MTPKDSKSVDQWVGAQIRLIRRQRKISQGELGKQIGLTFQQVQKYERGSNRVGAGRLFEIARVLEVSVSDFFVGIEGLSAVGSSKLAAKIALDADACRVAEAYSAILDNNVRKRLRDLIEIMALKLARSP